jgi:hypothetical protein
LPFACRLLVRGRRVRESVFDERMLAQILGMGAKAGQISGGAAKGMGWAAKAAAY